MGIIFTILTGLCFLIGVVAFQNSTKREEFSLFTLSLAFIVMIGLLLFDLLPELIETKNLWLLIPTIIGFMILVFLDKLIPHHHHEHTNKHCDKEDHMLHLNHIGIVTIISISLHNFIEGLSLYTLALNNVVSGALMMLSIALHNIPLGFQIGNSLKEKKFNLLLIIFLCLSSFLGALIIIIFGDLNSLVESILLALTFGMLFYILIFELFSEIKGAFNKKEVLYGIIIGVIILFITYLL